MTKHSTVFITGASSSIGQELIQRLLSTDRYHIIAHTHRSPLKAADPSRVKTIAADFESPEAVSQLISRLKNDFPPIDHIVHIAAPKFSLKRFGQLSWSHIEREIQIQLRSITEILIQMVPHMLGNSDRISKVIFVLSSATFNIPPKNTSHYTLVKMALLGLMKSLASEYGDKHIRFNAISPSMLDTDFISQTPSKLKEIVADDHPLKRLGTTADIVPALEFLLGHGSDFINGVNIPVTGGHVF